MTEHDRQNLVGTEAEADTPSAPLRRSASSYAVRSLSAVAILAIGGGLALYWMTHRPKAKRRRPRPRAALVEVWKARSGPHVLEVAAMGTVIPARTIELAARVAGEVVDTSAAFLPGGRFDEDDTVLTIDPSDYELRVRREQAAVLQREAELSQKKGDVDQRETDIELADIRVTASRHQVELRAAAVVRAENLLKIEMGRQLVAKREFRLLGETVAEEDRELVLRQPQLSSARAEIESARAAQRIAEAEVALAKAAKTSARVAKQTA